MYEAITRVKPEDQVHDLFGITLSDFLIYLRDRVERRIPRQHFVRDEIWEHAGASQPFLMLVAGVVEWSLPTCSRAIKRLGVDTEALEAKWQALGKAGTRAVSMGLRLNEMQSHAVAAAYMAGAADAISDILDGAENEWQENKNHPYR
jgi:hypothetical protein